MSLRTGPVEQGVDLPDGRTAIVRVGLFDPYVPPAEQTTVALEVRAGGEVLAALNTVLNPDDTEGANELVRAAAAGLGSGELEPSAEALEHLADSAR
jgi:hypothetical protein